jgi:hypothetical protein
MVRTIFPVVTLTLRMLTPSFAHGEPPNTTRAATASGAADVHVPCSTTGHYCHDGFYLRETVSLGYATLVSTGTASASTSSSTFSVTSAVGGTLAPGFVVGGVLGVGLSGAFQSPHAGAFIDWYPAATAGWHAGVSVEARLLTASLSGQSLTGVGPSTTLFAGYDWSFLRQWSFGLLASASAGTPQTMRRDGDGDSGFRFAPFEFVFGGTTLFH